MHKATITSLASADAADVLGATCGELRDGTALLKPLQQPQEDEQQMGKGMWWSLPAARAELLRLATEATPLYVYNTDVIKVRALQRLGLHVITALRTHRMRRRESRPSPLSTARSLPSRPTLTLQY